MATPILDLYNKLLDAASEVLKQSTRNTGDIAKVHQFIGDLTKWQQVISRTESQIILNCTRELQYGVFALVTGLYRQAFGSLRLSFELSLATVYYSTNSLEYTEWIQGAEDVRWAVLIDQDNGVMGYRYIQAFFPELKDEAIKYLTIAKTLYRSLSEFVHGNANTWELTPQNLSYNKDLFQDWMQKFKSVSIIITFCFILRFARDLCKEKLQILEAPILDTFGHNQVIRDLIS
jgi:hypothetical protein